jgi:RecG-like helicase
MLITTGKVDSNYQKQLNTLVDRALGISIAEHNKALMKLYTVAKGISDKADRKAIKPVLKELNKFTRQFSRSLQNYYKNNSSKIIKDILLMYPTGYSKDRSQFFNDLLNLDKRAIMIYSMVTALNKLPVYKNLTGFALHNMLLSEARRLRGFLAKSDLGNELNIIYDTITKGAEDTEFAGKYLRESIKVIDDAREHTRALLYGKVKNLLISSN